MGTIKALKAWKQERSHAPYDGSMSLNHCFIIEAPTVRTLSAIKHYLLQYNLLLKEQAIR